MIPLKPALLGLALLPPQAQERPRVTIPRIDAEVEVDGALDEPVWQQAARLSGFRQYEPVDGRPAEEETEVLVWYAPDAIHFGIVAHDSHPDRIRATQADRDAIGDDDHVVLYLDTFDDRRRAFFFAVNPLGVQQDGVRTEGASSAGRTFGGNTDTSPDFVYQSRGRLTPEGYVVEVRIPFKSLRFPGSGPQRWGLQVERRTQRTGYTDTWTDVRRANASFLLQAGTIEGLHDLERGVVFEAQPFATVSADGALDDASGRFTRGGAEPDAGVNLRVGFTNVSLDATINPDFSQVESDAGQVTINERFALFFPEKRPFFLEGIELFSTPGQLVYTRRIASPIAGGKLTGKFGPFALAHLTAVDQDVNEAGDEALFNVTRLRRDFGSNSLVGLTYTDRDLLESGDFNRVLSGDLRLVFARLYYLEAQLAESWTRDAAGPTRAGELWKLEVDRTGRSWGFNYALSGVGDDFRADAGFVNRTGIVTLRAFNRLSWYGAPGAALENLTFVLHPSRVWRYARFGHAGAIEGGESGSASFRLRGGWEVELEGGRSFYVLDPADYAELEVGTATGAVPYAPLDEVSGPAWGVRVETPTFQRLGAELGVEGGRAAVFDEGAEGRFFEAGAGLSLRPTDQLRLGLSGTYTRIERTRDGSEFARSWIPRLEAEFQATRALSFRAITELRAERRDALRDARTGQPLLRGGEPVAAREDDGLRLDLLAAYEPTPGTVAYLGYGSAYAEDPLRRDRVRRTRDGFFLKLAYQLRR